MPGRFVERWPIASAVTVFARTNRCASQFTAARIITAIQPLQWPARTSSLSAHFCIILDSGLDPNQTAARKTNVNYGSQNSYEAGRGEERSGVPDRCGGWA